MTFDHACFISFPRGSGKDTKFAEHFYLEFKEQLAVHDKKLSVFKYDGPEEHRRGDDWPEWIQRELCHSATMIAVCAPNYFNGGAGCASEFEGMKALIASRAAALDGLQADESLIVLRLKDSVPMGRLKPSYVLDFLDCCASPERIRKVREHRQAVEKLADRVYRHWCWLHGEGRDKLLRDADICSAFTLPTEQSAPADAFPHAGAVT